MAATFVKYTKGHIYKTALPFFIKFVAKCLRRQNCSSIKVKVNVCGQFPLRNLLYKSIHFLFKIQKLKSLETCKSCKENSSFISN